MDIHKYEVGDLVYLSCGEHKGFGTITEKLPGLAYKLNIFTDSAWSERFLNLIEEI